MRLSGSLLLFTLALILPPSLGQVEDSCSSQGEGFQCVDEHEAELLNCTSTTTPALASDTDTRLSVLPGKHCSGLLGSGQNCCRPPVIPQACYSKGCSNQYPGFQCVKKSETQDSRWCFKDLGVLCGTLGGGSDQCQCCLPKHVDCEDKGCSRRGDGYKCKNEKEAKEHPVPCIQSDRLCKKNCFIHNTGSRPYSPYNVDPSSPSPEDCQLKCQADPLCQWFNYVPASSFPSGCWLLKYAKTGETSAVSTIGWVTGPKYCSKCHCCPPEQEPPEPCEDTGCEKAFEGLGKCKDVKTANWDELDTSFDLAAGSRDNNTCKKKGTDQKDCCRCLKRKSCLDAGCKQEFNGNGICMDLSKADISYMKKTLDFSAGEIKGKCRNALKEDCCSCFKKMTPDCRNKDCEAKKGKCVIYGDKPPPNFQNTGVFCNETLKCHCWVPKDPPCDDEKCTKGMNGKCVGPDQHPPRGYVKSDYNCNNKDSCPCYVEKKECPPDKICTDGFGRRGQCGQPGPGLVKIDYNCNQDASCPCYVKGCEDEKCTDKKGKCVNLPNKPPTGYVYSGFNCQENQECPCYVEKKDCPHDDTCTDSYGLKGKCGEATAGYGKSSINCNQDPNCPCHLPCRNEKCEKSGGKCVLLSLTPALDVIGKPATPVGYKQSESWCNEKIGCNCFMPNCPTTKGCRAQKGSCFSTKPAGGVLINNKKAKCKKPCKCYRVPIPAIGIALPMD